MTDYPLYAFPVIVKIYKVMSHDSKAIHNLNKKNKSDDLCQS